MREISISLAPRDVTRTVFVLFGLEFCFWALYVSPHPFNSLALWFDLDREASIPTWFSSMQLFVTGSVAAYIASARRREKGSGRQAWRLIACLFFYLSMDEVGTIHEVIGDLVMRHAHVAALKTISMAWLAAFAPVVVLVTAFCIRFLIRNFAKSPRLMAWGFIGLGLWVSALGCEMVGGMLHWESMFRIPLIGLEEVLEMAGTTCWLFVVLSYAIELPQGRVNHGG